MHSNIGYIAAQGDVARRGRRERQIRQRRVVMRTKNADHKVDVQVYWVCNRRGREMNDDGEVVIHCKHKGGRKVCIEK